MIDLEVLTNRVRDSFSRRYFVESVRSYNAQAHRAAIISLWIAVVYDIVAKIRELAMNGDPAAIDFTTRLDRAIANRDVRTQQQMEQSVLDTARAEFGLFSDTEADDLARLMHDRHRCAHPALNEENALFEPTPELVRSHMRHAVDAVLSQPPVQGKAALDQITSELARQSFPSEERRANDYLRDKYLARCKPVLARNLTIVLIKTLLRGDERGRPHVVRNLRHALQSVASTHPGVYEETVREQLNRLMDPLDDDQILNVGHVVGTDGRAWGWISAANQSRVEERMRAVSPLDESDAVIDLLDIRDLREAFTDAFSALDEERQVELIGAVPHASLELPAATLYRERSVSYRSAEHIGSSVVEPLIPVLSARGVAAILEAVMSNGQIQYASGTPPLVERMFDNTKHLLPATAPAWKRFAEVAMESNAPDSYYAYPEVRKKIEEIGIEVEYPRVEPEDDEDAPF